MTTRTTQRSLATLALLLTALPAAAETFPTRDAAATAALATIADERYEHGGLVYRLPDGTFDTTAPATSRRTDSFELRARRGRDFPRAAEVVAVYHQHPRSAGPRGDAHSPHDVETADALGLASYVLEARTGQVRVYEPGERTKRPASYPRGAHLGRVVDTLPPR